MEAKDINFAAMPQTAIRVVTAPTEFFKTMPKTGGYLEPLVFAVVMGLTASIIMAIWSLLGFGYGGGPSPRLAAIFLSIIFTPVILAICSFIGAAIVFYIWKLMGSTQNYEVSYRCMAYLMALVPITAVIKVVPYAGTILSFVIVTFYIVIVSTEVHGIPMRKALQVFGIIGVVLIILSLYSEYSARNRYATPEQVRNAAEETAKQYQRYIDEARKKAESNR
jgi:Yip1 domain.